MHINKYTLVFASLSLVFTSAQAQFSDKTIPTAMSFLQTRPDARSSAMGDVGVATSTDAYSLYANPSKIAFSNHLMETGLSYMPLLPNLAKDVSLANFSGFRKMGEKGALGVSIYYLSYGKVDGKNAIGDDTQLYFPVEYTIDLTYARKMSNNFSMGLTARFLHSDMYSGVSPNSGLVVDPASAFAADVSMYYEKKLLSGLDGGTMSFGAMISNIGTKVKYSENKDQFLPTNLKLGAAYSFLIDGEAQKLTISMDWNKLLVPSPPIYDGNGEIVDGKDPNRSVVSALFSSFADAPGGFSEEWSEVSIGTGIEYLFDETFALRTGYFYENPEKGNRQHFTLGTGMKYKNFNFDLGYIIPTANRFVLKNSIKFSLGLNFK